ncbi:MAG TPA: exodeoxyribonuclease I [Pseudomonadales bacterium]|nr:exodeoxyribonuclease I [Pseudomonadales bacterium]
MTTHTTFYWHDYETWGATPSRDRPSQFAGVRTDVDFNIIGKPLCIYCRPCPDVLPQPDACLITGITPQKALAEGYSEAEFIAQIHREMSQPGTCSVGFNSLRFDDEVTRFTLWRNFYDPYEREWKNGNSRWDIIDMVRLTYALRPDGIVWPRRADDPTLPSFRLEELSKANGIAHEAAHDAMSDVYATIGLAKLIKQKQPKLFDYVFQMRDKHKVLELLNWREQKPVLYVSSMVPASQGCLTLLMPIAQHPSQKNVILCIDLLQSPVDLLARGAAELRELLYTRREDLPEGQERLPIVQIKANQCPVIATTQLLDEASQGRLGIDMVAARRHWKLLHDAIGLDQKLRDIFAVTRDFDCQDPEQALYGEFVPAHDKPTMQQVRRASGQDLAETTYTFHDKRLQEMLFRYRARNFPESLSEQDRLQWADFCFQRLSEGLYPGDMTLEMFHTLIEQKWHGATPAQRRVLEALAAYGDELLC